MESHYSTPGYFTVLAAATLLKSLEIPFYTAYSGKNIGAYFIEAEGWIKLTDHYALGGAHHLSNQHPILYCEDRQSAVIMAKAMHLCIK